MSPAPALLRPALVPWARLRRDRIRSQDQVVFPEGVLEVNASGVEILRLCDGRTVGAIIEALETKFAPGPGEGSGPPDSAIATDVIEFLQDMLERGLLRECEAR